MTQIATIATPQTAAATAATGQGAALSGAAGGVFGAMAGMNFMDMIFARTAATAGASADAATVLKAPVVVHPSFTANTQALSAAQIALTARAGVPGINSAPGDVTAGDIDLAALNDILVQLTGTEHSGETTAGLTTAAAPSLPLTPAQKEEIAKVINNLLHGLPAEAKAAIQSEIAADPALIATPLTPSALADLLERLAADPANAAEGLVSIVAPQTAAQRLGLIAPVKATAGESSVKPVRIEKIADADAALNIASAIAAQLAAIPLNDTAVVTDAEFAARLNAVTPGTAPTAPAAPPAGAAVPGYVPNAAATGDAPAASNNAAGGSSFAAGASAAAGLDGLLNGAGWESMYPDGLEWAQGSSGGAAPSLNLTGPSQFASLVAHAQSAASPHPATQMVAATLTRAAAEGETKTMTLKLDPPELGRIEIRMDFGKEKGMKAHIVTEKPETHLMLQRDAHVLERALQNAGLDTSDGGLSFTLSQDGNLFSDGHNGGNRGAGGGDASAGDSADGDEIIETTMTWSVDADGMTHYDILA